MDTFMDKLAQKLTAQEMIKANTAAEAEELSSLKKQNREYQDVLEQLQKLLAQEAEKLENTKTDESEVKALLSGQKETLENLKQTLEEQKTAMQEQKVALEEQKAALEQDKTASDEEKTAFGEKLDNVNENVHKECVKVYRNVQAAVTEENGKQTETVVATVKGLKGKLGAVLGISIAALAVSVGGVVLQVLVWLQIL